MVERGGLDYGISIRDEFSEKTELFRKELRASKAEFLDFQKTLSSKKGQSAVLKEEIRLLKELRTIRKRAAAAKESAIAGDRFEQKRLRTIRDLKDQTKLLADAEVREARDSKRQSAAAEKAASSINQKVAAEKAAIRAAKDAARAEKQLSDARNRQATTNARALQKADETRRAIEQRRLREDIKSRSAADPRLQAEKRINKELFQQRIILEQISQLKTRAAAQFAGGDIVGGRATVARAEQLEKSLKGSSKAANNLFFTFRRLVGVFAVFALVRRGAQEFQNLVASGIKFNDTIQASTVGIAGLVATLGDVRNEFGESVSTAEQLNLALGISRKQIQLLRQDSLRTVATFSQLLDTFQVAVGPGLAAGLNLDEVRKLTVQISQAASALSVPQNQLAEEIRSLLAGTIQARTTRIATALGITNADIRALKETGELFDFLEDRLKGFAVAAELQARTTLDGIRTLIVGATQELLGQSARPLFDELLSLGNDLFDNVITIRDEAGNIRPNPQALAAFSTLFDSLRQGVVAAREFGEELGFEGLQNIIGTIGTGLTAGIQAAIGAAKVFGATFSVIASIIREIADLFGLTNQNLGSIAAVLGEIFASVVLFRQVTKLLGLDWGKLFATVKKMGPSIRAIAVGPVGLLAAAIGVVLLGFNQVAQAIFNVELGIKDTISLIGLGLFSAINKVVEVVQVLGTAISSGLQNALETVVSSAKDKALSARSFIASLFGDDKESQSLELRRIDEALAAENRISARKKESAVEIADIRAQAAAAQLGIEQEIAKIVGDAAGKSAQGPGFDPTIDPTAFDDLSESVTTFVSTADKPINELAESLTKVNDELIKANLEFAQATASAGAGGFGGKVESIFNKEEIANAERLRKIRVELSQTEEKIADLRSQGMGDEQGELVSLLRDEADLRDAINVALDASNTLSVTRAATAAAQMLPTLVQENALLQAQVASEQALTAARVSGVGARQQAIIAARAAVALASTEALLAREKADQDIRAAEARLGDATGDEALAIEALLTGLRQRRDLESEILDLKLSQLQKSQEEAELVANGSVGEGMLEGLRQLSDELPNAFELGLELTKQVVTDFANFAGSSIVNAIVNAQQEGVDESELFEEAAAQFALQLATQIMQQVISNLIEVLLTNTIGRAAQDTAATTANEAVKGTALAARITAQSTAVAADEATKSTAAALRNAAALTTAQTIAALKAVGGGAHTGGLVRPEGFNAGGMVPRMDRIASKATSRAKGYHKGGRPSGLHPLDTVPAYLQPGEFVMRKAVVDSLGAGFFADLNGGNMPVVASAAAEAAGPGGGMQTGGLVSDRLAAAQSSQGEESGEGQIVLPVLVAQDSEMDQLTAGGTNAFLAFMRENAGDINSLLDRS